MLLETYILYVLPLLARIAISGLPLWYNLILSQLSIFVVFPSTFLPRLVPDALREHVYRHALYALAFTIAIPTTTHLDRVSGPFLTFCILGLVTLWWFVLSHWLENTVDTRINTHQGDITVLPLTLVAIATFVVDLPIGVFRYTRSTVFFVPIVVAWATMFFLAFQDFAVQCTTTHEHPAFMYYAYASLVVSIVHLLLIETGVSSHTYQVFPLVAALFCQCIPDFLARPRMRPRRRAATVVWVSIASVGVFYAAMRGRLEHAKMWIFLFANACTALVLPPVNGRRWVVPGCALATLATWKLYDTDFPYDVVAIIACHYLVLLPTNWIVRPALEDSGHSSLPRGTIIVFHRVTKKGYIQHTYFRLLSVQVLEENERHTTMRVATWFIPGIWLLYTEHDITLQSRVEERGDHVRAIVA